MSPEEPITPVSSVSTESTLPQGADLFRTLFLEHPDGVALTVEGKLAIVNRRFAEMSGYSTQAVIGMAPSELVGPEEREHLDDRIQALTAGSPELPATYSMVRKDGSSLPVEVHSKPIQHDGKPAILTVLRDISDRMQAEE